MKLKSLLALSLAAVLSASLIAGCSNKKNGTTSSGTSSSQSSSSTSSASSEEVSTIEGGHLKDVHQAVKDMLGENYIPSAELDAAYLEEQMGITSDMVKEFIAEGPMISAHVDTFIGIEAAEGKAEDVEKKLNDYRQTLVDDSLQYPMNAPKVKASAVTREGNYVFFTLLGAYNEEDEIDEEGLLTYYEGETKKVVDKIKDALTK